MMTRIKHWLQRYYILLIVAWVFVYTWPLFNAADNTAGVVGDALYYPGYHAWFCDNFFANRFQVNDFFAPIGVNLQAGYDMPLLSTVSCVFRSMGPVFMSNIIQVLHVFLIFFSSYLLARKFINNKTLQVSFIFLYSFSSFYIGRSQSHFNVMSSIWGTALVIWVFYNLNWLKLWRVAGAFVVLAAVILSNWQNIPNLFVPIGFMLTASWLASKDKVKSTLYVGLGLVVCILLSWPFMRPILTAYTSNQRTIDIESATWFNADIITYIVPHSEHWSRGLFSSLVSKFQERKDPYFEAINAFDIAAIVLVMYGLLTRWQLIKQFLWHNKLLLAIALWSFLAAFGPYVSVLGRNVIPLPYYQLLMKYPPYSLTRTPARISIVVLCVGYLLLFAYLDKHKPSSKFILLLMMYSILSTTVGSKNLFYSYLNIHQLIPESGLQQIQSNPQPSYVLNVPIALMSDPTQNFLQLYHHKPLIAGYVSYASMKDTTLSYINSYPILKSMACQPMSAEYATFMNTVITHPNEAVDAFQEAHVTYIIVNTEMLKKNDCEMVNRFVVSMERNPQIYSRLDANQMFRVYKIIP